ncbi:hypothetical protein KI387_023738, partial [Taxus chinensis]
MAYDLQLRDCDACRNPAHPRPVIKTFKISKVKAMKIAEGDDTRLRQSGFSAINFEWGLQLTCAGALESLFRGVYNDCPSNLLPFGKMSNPINTNEAFLLAPPVKSGSQDNSQPFANSLLKFTKNVRNNDILDMRYFPTLIDSQKTPKMREKLVGEGEWSYFLDSYWPKNEMQIHRRFGTMYNNVVPLPRILAIVLIYTLFLQTTSQSNILLVIADVSSSSFLLITSFRCPTVQGKSCRTTTGMACATMATTCKPSGRLCKPLPV